MSKITFETMKNRLLELWQKADSAYLEWKEDPSVQRVWRLIKLVMQLLRLLAWAYIKYTKHIG